MILEILKECWNWIKNLHPEVVRVICFILIVLLIMNYTSSGIKDIFSDQLKSENVEKQKREAYTIEITPTVNKHIRDIISKDSNASNVILLNYHNTLLSSHGLSYRYLTAICEQFKGINSKPCSEYWKELEYMNYGEEVHKISTASCVIFSNLSEMRESFPKFTYILERSGFKSAVAYPIEGVDGAVGMLIVGYEGEMTPVTTDYIRKVIAPNIQPLSTLLDYNYVKKLSEI